MFGAARFSDAGGGERRCEVLAGRVALQKRVTRARRASRATHRTRRDALSPRGRRPTVASCTPHTTRPGWPGRRFRRRHARADDPPTWPPPRTSDTPPRPLRGSAPVHAATPAPFARSSPTPPPARWQDRLSCQRHKRRMRNTIARMISTRTRTPTMPAGSVTGPTPPGMSADTRGGRRCHRARRGQSPATTGPARTRSVPRAGSVSPRSCGGRTPPPIGGGSRRLPQSVPHPHPPSCSRHGGGDSRSPRRLSGSATRNEPSASTRRSCSPISSTATVAGTVRIIPNRIDTRRYIRVPANRPSEVRRRTAPLPPCCCWRTKRMHGPQRRRQSTRETRDEPSLWVPHNRR
jgi:hypothetical protein